MHKSIINPNISAHEELFGIINFNLTPFAPPETRILVCDNPENRATYAPRGSYGWYIGRSQLHHICFKCYMTCTKVERTSDSVDLLPHHFEITKTSSAYVAAIAELKSICALENPTLASLLKVKEPTLYAIKKLSKIFKCAVQPPDTQWPQQGN